MAFVPYSRQSIAQSDIDAVADVLRSSHLTQGPAVDQFERDFCELHQVRNAAAVSNATVALHLACLGLDVGPGSRVWTSPISFVASANCALYCGASIDFVDIDSESRLMSVDALTSKLEDADKRGTLPDVVIPVDLTGLACDYAAIRKLADRYGFRILADSSHAVGASYKDAPVGSEFVDAAVFSFHAVKIVTTGEGGIVATNDDILAERIRLLRSHGITRDRDLMEREPPGEYYYEQIALGLNARMTDIQAALGSSQLKRLPEMHSKRINAANSYDEILANRGLILPPRYDDRQSSWHLYVIEFEDRAECDRDRIFSAMRRDDFGVNLHYLPIHLQPYYRSLGFCAGQFPAAETYAKRAISIPLYPDMEDGVLHRVASHFG